jgi:hypothetical protein
MGENEKFVEAMLKSAKDNQKPKAQNLTDNVALKDIENITKNIKEKIQRVPKE